MDKKHMTIKIFGKANGGADYLMWSPIENNQVKVVTSQGWILEDQQGKKTLLEENKNYSVNKGQSYLIHKGHGQLVLGILHNEQNI